MNGTYTHSGHSWLINPLISYSLLIKGFAAQFSPPLPTVSNLPLCRRWRGGPRRRASAPGPRVGRGAPRRGAAPRASAPRLKRAPRASAPRAPRAVSGPCCPGKRRVPVRRPEMDWRLRLQRAVTRYSLHLCFCPATRNYTKLQPAGFANSLISLAGCSGSASFSIPSSEHKKEIKVTGRCRISSKKLTMSINQYRGSNPRPRIQNCHMYH